MASILTSKQEISDVVLFEQFKEYGFCRSREVVNITAAAEIGLVCQDKVSDNTYEGVANGDVATLTSDLVILIDDKVYEYVQTNDLGDKTVAVLKMPVNGSAGLKRGGLKYLDAVSGANKTTVEAALEALGMKVYQTA